MEMELNLECKDHITCSESCYSPSLGLKFYNGYRLYVRVISF